MAKKRLWNLETRKILAVSSLGLILPSSIAVGLFLGYIMDKTLGTHPWMLMTFLLFGTISGMYSLIRGLNRLKDEEKTDDNKN